MNGYTQYTIKNVTGGGVQIQVPMKMALLTGDETLEMINMLIAAHQESCRISGLSQHAAMAARRAITYAEKALVIAEKKKKAEKKLAEELLAKLKLNTDAEDETTSDQAHQ